MTLNANRWCDRKRTARMAVKVDGVLLPDCFYADGRRRVARTLVRDENGRILVDHENHCLMRREVRGKITWVKL